MAALLNGYRDVLHGQRTAGDLWGQLRAMPDANGMPQVCLSCVYRVSMVYIWCVCGVSVVCLSCVYLCVCHVLVVSVSVIVCLLWVYGVYMVCIWCVCGVPIV